MSSELRARFTLPRIAIAAALIAGVLALSALLEPDEAGAPADQAARLVPAEVLAYVHVSIDRDSEQWRNATVIGRRFPGLIAARDRFLRGLTARGGGIDLDREVYPWLGDEAALALLDGAEGRARSLILLEVSDREIADAFLARAVGRVRRSVYRGTAVRSYGQLATAYLGDFLAIGRAANLRAAIDTRLARAGSLADSPAFIRARAGLPDRERLLYAYASRTGLFRVLAAQPGLAGRLARFADEPGLQGAAAALRAEPDLVRIDFASAVGRFSPLPEDRESFRPRLAEAVPRDAIAYIGMRGADRIFEAVSRALGGTRLRLPPALERLRSELSGRDGARVRRELRPLLDKEAALFVSPSEAPLLTLVIDRVGTQEAGTIVERLQPVLVRLLQRPAAGQVPTFRPVRVAGLDAATLSIGPGVKVTYAVFGGRAVVSTSPAGIRKVKAARRRIPDNPLFRPDLQRLTDVTSVLFLDLEQLLALGEQAGLGESSSYRALKADLARISAVSAVTSSASTGRTAAIFIEVP